MNTITDTLRRGGIGILVTDTIYGIVGQALDQDTVERIYSVKKRTPTKPFIILINSIKDLSLFNVTVNDTIQSSLEKYWPGPVSVIIDCLDPDFEYLHRGTNSLAFRMPAKSELQEMLRITGPLVAPSANPEGLEPARNIDEAKDYFGDTIDFYSEGSVNTTPSKIIRITEQGEQVIRA